MEPIKRVRFGGLTGPARWESPQEMLEDFEGYIQWCEDHPLKEQKLIGNEGETASLDKMRMPTIEGFARHLRTSSGRIIEKCQASPIWMEAFLCLKDAMFSLSIEGAAAGLLKEAIVAKKLRLAEEIKVTNTVKRVVIMHTPDNGRAIEAPSQGQYLEYDDQSGISSDDIDSE